MANQERIPPASAPAEVRVLVIEDDPAQVRLVRDMLAAAALARFLVEGAASLSEGLQRASADSFDIVLLDLTLPDSSGLDTLSRFSRASNLPVVVLTSLDDREMAVSAITRGARDYLVKGQVDGYLLARALLRQIEGPPSSGKSGVA